MPVTNPLLSLVGATQQRTSAVGVVSLILSEGVALVRGTVLQVDDTGKIRMNNGQMQTSVDGGLTYKNLYAGDIPVQSVNGAVPDDSGAVTIYGSDVLTAQGGVPITNLLVPPFATSTDSGKELFVGPSGLIWKVPVTEVTVNTAYLSGTGSSAETALSLSTAAIARLTPVPTTTKSLVGAENGANKSLSLSGSFQITSDVLSLVPATTSLLGGVSIGSGVTVDASGKISVWAPTEDQKAAIGAAAAPTAANPFATVADVEAAKNINDKGYFVTAADLRAAYPVGQGGWYATVGETDTMWFWDSDTADWVDGNKAASTSHNVLLNRDAVNAHPMAAITGLDAALADKLAVATAWDTSTSYAIGATVTKDGSLYQSKTADNQGNDPVTSTTNWLLIVAKGQDSTVAGPPGPQGTLTEVTPYDPAATYTLLALVYKDGSTWQLTASAPAGTAPVEGSSYWTKVAAAGSSTYLYIRYASDNTGADFTEIPGPAVPYRAELQTTTPITPTVADFTGKWQKYLGEVFQDILTADTLLYEFTASSLETTAGVASLVVTRSQIGVSKGYPVFDVVAPTGEVMSPKTGVVLFRGWTDNNTYTVRFVAGQVGPGNWKLIGGTGKVPNRVNGVPFNPVTEETGYPLCGRLDATWIVSFSAPVDNASVVYVKMVSKDTTVTGNIKVTPYLDGVAMTPVVLPVGEQPAWTAITFDTATSGMLELVRTPVDDQDTLWSVTGSWTAYSETTAYAVDDVVRYQGAFWKCIQATAAGTTPAAGDYWEAYTQAVAVTAIVTNLGYDVIC